MRSKQSGFVVGFAVLSAVLLGLTWVLPDAALHLWVAAGVALVAAWVMAVRRDRGSRRG